MNNIRNRAFEVVLTDFIFKAKLETGSECNRVISHFRFSLLSALKNRLIYIFMVYF